MTDLPLLTIHTDGASRGNPGEAACAYVISRAGQPIIEVAERLGLMTNNQAEYTALVRALEHALELGAEHRLLIHSDSELMVKQMRGEYRVKNEELRELYQDACDLVRQFQGGVTLQHVRRAQNSRADALCNEVLDGKRPSQTRQTRAEGAVAAAASAQPTLRDLALARLSEAAQDWRKGGAATVEEVWNDLVRILVQQGVKIG